MNNNNHDTELELIKLIKQLIIAFSEPIAEEDYVIHLNAFLDILTTVLSLEQMSNELWVNMLLLVRKAEKVFEDEPELTYAINAFVNKIEFNKIYQANIEPTEEEDKVLFSKTFAKVYKTNYKL